MLTPLARPIPTGQEEMPLTSQIEILFVSANALSPIHRQRIRPEEEYRDIKHKLLKGRHGRLFKLLPPLFATRIDDLQEGLSYHRPHVVHFAGHASPSGIELENEYGRVVKVSIQSLTHLFEAVNRPAFNSDGGRVKLIVLHACSTVGHAEALSAVADFTIGTPADVRDEDSINFAPAFYSALANGQSLVAALASARAVAKTKNYLTEHALELFCKRGADPNLPFITHVLGWSAAGVKRPRAVKDVPPPSEGRPGEGPRPAQRKAGKGRGPGKRESRFRQYEVEDGEREKELKQAMNRRRKKR